jgi:hypothetical protein
MKAYPYLGIKRLGAIRPHLAFRGITGVKLKGKNMIKRILTIVLTLGTVSVLTSCATIVNDPNIPIAVNFSDGSPGKCTFKNKRGVWTADIPTQNAMIRRSDDSLMYDCTTSDGRQTTGSIRSEVEGEKMAASVIFWDFGITDAITDKHRTYQGNVVIAVPPKK